MAVYVLKIPYDVLVTGKDASISGRLTVRDLNVYGDVVQNNLGCKPSVAPPPCSQPCTPSPPKPPVVECCKPTISDVSAALEELLKKGGGSGIWNGGSGTFKDVRIAGSLRGPLGGGGLSLDDSLAVAGRSCHMGQVGIGTRDPKAMLHVDGGLLPGVRSTVLLSNGAMLAVDRPSPGASIHNGRDTILEGLVRIGTTASPQSSLTRLLVQGRVDVPCGDGGTGLIVADGRVGIGTAPSSVSAMTGAGGSGERLQVLGGASVDGGLLLTGRGGTDRQLVLDGESGNLGLGPSRDGRPPTSRLQVHGTTSLNGAVTVGARSATSPLPVDALTVYGSVRVGDTLVAGRSVGVGTASLGMTGVAGLQAWGEAHVFRTGGVGIGTAPKEGFKLTVAGMGIVHDTALFSRPGMAVGVGTATSLGLDRASALTVFGGSTLRDGVRVESPSQGGVALRVDGAVAVSGLLSTSARMRVGQTSPAGPDFGAVRGATVVGGRLVVGELELPLKGGIVPGGTALYVAGSAKVTGDVTGASYQTISDARLKKEKRPVADALMKLSQLRGMTYQLIGEDRRRAGLLAQDVQRVLPEAVTEGEDGFLCLAYGDVLALVVEAIKQLATGKT
jgi:Chaperone of endosialidase